MKLSTRKKQKGVFAIEFALGFFVLFMFTVLIFEVCRLTYICSLLDYASAEAARDARVQLNKNHDFIKYKGKNCHTDVPKNETSRCQKIQSYSGNQFAIWFHSFLSTNGGKLWQVFTASNEMFIKTRHYKNLHALAHDASTSSWSKNSISMYEVTYKYQPIFFKWSFSNSDIKRHVLVIDEFERHQSANK
ncbi:TadE/TadG family type IV pilus assembly protein [Photobacterium kagoshimensis]|uniref:TadE/TadG family type IV pilus assembly protein n=1 Tax=Photobacterium kagoshimensis TaxID=2910242 RepID=UPI003D10B6EE